MTIFFELALTLYFAGFLLSIAEILKREINLDKAIFLCSITGFCLHTIYLSLRYIISGQAPVFSMHEATAFFAWSILFICLGIFFSYRTKILNFGVVLGFVLMFVSAFFPRAFPNIKPELKGFWIDLHALLSLAGVAFFSVAFIFSLLYLFQDKAVKSKKISGFTKILPSLEMLDKINYRLIFLGFPFYTMGLLVGVFKYVSLLGFVVDAKQLWSFLNWFVFFAIFYLRVKGDWRKKKAAYLTIFGFLLVIFGFFGINLLTEGFHRRI